MNQEEFVDAVIRGVLDDIAPGMEEQYRHPSGRPPPKDPRLVMSAWYNALSAEDRVMLRKVMELAARASIFGLFCVLDQSRKIHNHVGADDYFELTHVHDGTVDVLGGPRARHLLKELLGNWGLWLNEE